jgi:hypothetical protein
LTEPYLVRLAIGVISNASLFGQNFADKFLQDVRSHGLEGVALEFDLGKS